MKKGQLMGEGFKIIFIVIVIALSLFFGFKAVSYLLDYSETIQFNSFLVELRGEVDKVSALDKGSSVSLSGLNIPSNLVEICFFDGGGLDWDGVENELFKENLKIFVELERDYNSYFYILGEDIKFDRLDFKLELGNEPNKEKIPMCFDVSGGSFDARLVNNGRDGVFLVRI